MSNDYRDLPPNHFDNEEGRFMRNERPHTFEFMGKNLSDQRSKSAIQELFEHLEKADEMDLHFNPKTWLENMWPLLEKAKQSL